jgi:hypothetical protein
MPKYEHVIPKGEAQGFSQDPPQDVSNASSALLNRDITVKDAALTGIGIMYGKKILTAGSSAIVGQLGNARLERAIDIGKKGVSYLLIGVASGPLAPVTVGGAIVTDIAVKGITDSVTSHNLALENKRIILERGVMMSMGTGGYYD